MSKSKNTNLGSVLTKSPGETIHVYITSNDAHGEQHVFIVKNEGAYAFTPSSILDTGAQAVAHHIVSENVIDVEVIPHASKSLSFTEECNTAILSILQMYLAHVGRQNQTKTKKDTKTNTKKTKTKKDTCSYKNGRRK